MRRTYLIPRAKAPIPGLEQSFVFPQAANPPGLQFARAQPPSPQPPILTAVAPAHTSIFPLSQPLGRRSFLVKPKFTVITGTVPSVSSASVFTYPVVQPDPAVSQAWLNSPRYRQDVPLVVHQGRVPDTTSATWRLVTTPDGYSLLRQQIAPTLPIAGLGTAPLPTDLYQSAIPPDLSRYYERPKPVLTIRSIRGLTTPLQVPPPAWSIPSAQWWRRGDQTRSRLGPIPSLSGPLVAPTYIFPVHQPERAHWYLRRAAVQFPLPPRTDGPEPQALFLFTLSQPQGWTLERVVSRFVVTPQVLGAFTPPPVAQTSLFPPHQPVRAQWYQPRTPSEQVPAPLLIQQGATDTATSPIPTVGGSAHTHWPWRYQLFETCTTSRSPVIWSEILIVLPPPLPAADACDTFLVPAEARIFVVSAEAAALMVRAEPGSFTVSAEPGVFRVPGCNS